MVEYLVGLVIGPESVVQSDPAYFEPLVTILGNLSTTYDDEIMLKLLHTGAIEALSFFLDCGHSELPTLAQWGLSNIAVHSVSSANQLIEHQVLVTTVHAMNAVKKPHLQREALFTIGSLLSTADDRHLTQMFTEFPGLLEAYVTRSLLEGNPSDEKSMMHTLQSIQHLLAKRGGISSEILLKLDEFDFEAMFE